MSPNNISSLNGLPYRDESYFDFVVAERPTYIPGTGPPLAPISVLPPHDKDGIIIEKTFIQKELRYIVGYEDNPHLKVCVRPDRILDWVSSRTLETWESEDYAQKEKEREAIELPAILAREAAKRKRIEKLSRDRRPKVDGRRTKRMASHAEGSSDSSLGVLRRRGRPGRSPKSPAGTYFLFSSGAEDIFSE